MTRNILAEAVEAWRALDPRDRDEVIATLSEASTHHVHAYTKRWGAMLALLRAAAEPEAKDDMLNVTPISRTMLCQACGTITVGGSCVAVDGFIYHRECLDRRRP